MLRRTLVCRFGVRVRFWWISLSLGLGSSDWICSLKHYLNCQIQKQFNTNINWNEHWTAFEFGILDFKLNLSNCNSSFCSLTTTELWTYNLRFDTNTRQYILPVYFFTKKWLTDSTWTWHLAWVIIFIYSLSLLINRDPIRKEIEHKQYYYFFWKSIVLNQLQIFIHIQNKYNLSICRFWEKISAV